VGEAFSQPNPNSTFQGHIMQHFNKSIAAIFLAVASAFVQAQQAAYDFDIPAQPASQVLDALAKQTGLQPFYAEGAVKGAHSPGVKGKLSLREALDKALAGTGLSYQFTAEKAVAIKAVPAERVAKLAVIEVKDSAHASPLGLLQLDGIAKTGSRLGLSIRDTPGSITLIDRSNIEARDARSSVEALIAAPGVHASATSAAPTLPGFVAMRGFSMTQVTQMFNGISVQYDPIAARPFDSWLLERVEVVGGPTTYLHGNGAVGGAINYVSKVAERREQSQDIYASYGSFNTGRLAYGVNSAIGGKDAGNWIRFDISRQQSSGFVADTRSEQNSLALSWLSDITPAITHTLAYERIEDKRSPYYGTPLLLPTTNGAVDPSTIRTNYNVTDGLSSSQVNWLRSLAEWKVTQSTKITNTLYHYGAERLMRNLEAYRWNATNTAITRANMYANRHDQDLWGDRLEFVHEGRLLGLETTWAGGLDISRNHHINYPFSKAAVDTVNPYSPERGEYFSVTAGAQDATNPDRENTVKTTAVFLENRTKLLPTLSLVTGLRHDSIRINSINHRTVTATNPYSFDIAYSKVTGRMGAIYDLTPSANIYAQYSTAADPPATAVLATISPSEARDFPLTTGTQWELGSKFDLWEKRASGTIAAYRVVRRNLSIADPANPAGPPLPVGQQSASGLEVSLGANLSRSWRIQANAGYTNAQYDKFLQASGATTISRAGNVPANTPRLTTNTWLTWHGLPDLEAGVWVRYVGSRFGDTANTIQAPGYTTLDLFGSYKLDKNTTLTARLRNATDKLYVSYIAGTPMFIFGEPRSFELAVRSSF
jgi:iron complex outermembrane receptor protein